MKTPTISEHMVRYPYVVAPEASITEANEYMQELGVRHLPVVSDERLLGIISDRDLKAALSKNDKQRTVDEIMKRDVYIVNSHTSLAEVAGDMADGKIGSAVVVDVQGSVIGIFTTTDALRILAQRLEGENVESFLSSYQNYDDELLVVNTN